MSASKSDCILWTGPIRKDGYGRVHINGQRHYAHRVAYSKSAGVPLSKIKGVIVRHKCDNPTCVNPDHLIPGTHEDNMRDKTERERNARGEEHGSAKLTEAQVEEIRQSYTGARGQQVVMAKKYGVTQSQISHIVTGKHWTYSKGIAA